MEVTRRHQGEASTTVGVLMLRILEKLVVTAKPIPRENFMDALDVASQFCLHHLLCHLGALLRGEEGHRD